MTNLEYLKKAAVNDFSATLLSWLAANCQLIFGCDIPDEVLAQLMPQTIEWLEAEQILKEHYVS